MCDLRVMSRKCKSLNTEVHDLPLNWSVSHNNLKSKSTQTLLLIFSHQKTGKNFFLRLIFNLCN